MADHGDVAPVAPDSSVKPRRELKEGESHPFTQTSGCGIIRCMRTTLDIEEDVLQAAKELAQRAATATGTGNF